MVTKKRKLELNQKYKIKEVGGGQFEEGFYDALNYFDKNYKCSNCGLKPL